MGARLKKITIDNLEIGMFIVKMDVSWIKSPFLLHRRSIKTNNDIALLKKAGVKKLTIDLDKSQLLTQKSSQIEKQSQSKQQKDPLQAIAYSDVAEQVEFIATPEHLQENISYSDKLEQPSVPLNEEMERANELKKQANLSFNAISAAVKDQQAISVETLSPVIDETVSSLLRNSQALLTLINLKRYGEKLFLHSFSVMTLALTIAIKDGVAEEELRSLGLAALLHDIGWAQLPLNLFGKAKQYTDNEIKVVRQHLMLSNVIISQSNDIDELTKELIMLHHERSDGSGYPASKTEKEIPALAKILILADYFDETVHGLLDRPGVIAAEALKLFYKESVQNKLDKLYVEMLIKLLGIYPLCSIVELNTKEKAIVIEVNRDKPLAPIVKILYSSDGSVLEPPMEIDLQKDNNDRQIKNLITDIDEQIDPHHILVMNQV